LERIWLYCKFPVGGGGGGGLWLQDDSARLTNIRASPDLAVTRPH